MDEKGLITNNKSDVRTLAVDGLIFGLLSGLGMVLMMAVMTTLTGNSVKVLLERFSPGGMTSPTQGLLGHLGVSAVYGTFFSILFWPVLRRFITATAAGWFGGLGYALMLLVLAQVAILPGVNSPLLETPFYIWAAGHAIYGLILGGLFARKVV